MSRRRAGMTLGVTERGRYLGVSHLGEPQLYDQLADPGLLLGLRDGAGQPERCGEAQVLPDGERAHHHVILCRGAVKGPVRLVWSYARLSQATIMFTFIFYILISTTFVYLHFGGNIQEMESLQMF